MLALLGKGGASVRLTDVGSTRYMYMPDTACLGFARCNGEKFANILHNAKECAILEASKIFR